MGAWALRDLTFAAAMAGVLALTLAPHTQARGRVVPLVLWACLAMSTATMAQMCSHIALHDKGRRGKGFRQRAWCLQAG